MRTLEEIIGWLFGRRYYANIVHTRGTDICELCCLIFRTRDEAMAHKERLRCNLTYEYVETVVFRSRKDY